MASPKESRAKRLYPDRPTGNRHERTYPQPAIKPPPPRANALEESPRKQVIPDGVPIPNRGIAGDRVGADSPPPYDRAERLADLRGDGEDAAPVDPQAAEERLAELDAITRDAQASGDSESIRNAHRERMEIQARLGRRAHVVGGIPTPQPRTCRACGCTDDDCSGCIERTGAPCVWVEPDLCSACAPPAAA